MIKKYFILISILLITLNVFSQNEEENLFDKFLGKWNVENENENFKAFEIWTKNNDKIIISYFNVFGNDTVNFNTKEIVTKNGKVLLYLIDSYSNNTNIENSFHLESYYNNHILFANDLKDEPLSINYYIKDVNHVYFWIEFEDSNFNVDYMLIRDNE